MAQCPTILELGALKRNDPVPISKTVIGLNLVPPGRCLYPGGSILEGSGDWHCIVFCWETGMREWMFSQIDYGFSLGCRLFGVKVNPGAALADQLGLVKADGFLPSTGPQIAEVYREMIQYIADRGGYVYLTLAVNNLCWSFTTFTAPSAAEGTNLISNMGVITDAIKDVINLCEPIGNIIGYDGMNEYNAGFGPGFQNCTQAQWLSVMTLIRDAVKDVSSLPLTFSTGSDPANGAVPSVSFGNGLCDLWDGHLYNENGTDIGGLGPLPESIYGTSEGNLIGGQPPVCWAGETGVENKKTWGGPVPETGLLWAQLAKEVFVNAGHPRVLGGLWWACFYQDIPASNNWGFVNVFSPPGLADAQALGAAGTTPGLWPLTLDKAQDLVDGIIVPVAGSMDDQLRLGSPLAAGYLAEQFRTYRLPRFGGGGASSRSALGLIPPLCPPLLESIG